MHESPAGVFTPAMLKPHSEPVDCHCHPGSARRDASNRTQRCCLMCGRQARWEERGCGARSQHAELIE